MAVSRQQLTTYLADLLDVEQFSDYAPNGLQVEGKATIERAVTGVTACQQLVDAAAEKKADAIIVHHGYFWRGESPVIVGPMRQRLQQLLTHNINLFAYHLPLDCHDTLGNNALLSQALGASVIERHCAGGVPGLLTLVELDKAISASQFATRTETALGRRPLLIEAGTAPIKRLALCSGAAQDYLPLAASLGADAYLSGEISERTTHLARELGCHYFAAGHHATERFGVNALGDHLAQHFSLQVDFIDIFNPV